MRRLWAAVRKFVVDTWFVFVSQALAFRHMWFWSVVMVTFIPLCTMGFLLLFGKPSPERITYILTGSITYAVSSQAGLSLGQWIGGLKMRRVFDYYASLPISKLSFIYGLNLNALLLCVPSSLLLVVISVLGFHHPVRDPLLFLVAFVLGGFSLAGVGAMIGFYSRSGQIASNVTQIVDPILVFFAPVYMPEEALPLVLRYTSWFMPTRHVARLLRSSFGGATGGEWQSIAILVGFIIISVLLVHHGLDWRGDRPLA